MKRAILFFCLIILSGILVRVLLGEICVIHSHSMYPTLQQGDCIWMDKLTYGACLPQKIGDIPLLNVITKIKKVNEWSERFAWGYCRIPFSLSPLQQGDIVVVNTPHHPQLLIKRIIDVAESPGENYYFVQGDNRENSIDSHTFGYISEKEIIGKVNRVLFSISSDSENGSKIRFGRFFHSLK